MQHTNKLVILWLLCSVVNLVLCKSLSTEQQTVDDDVDGYQGDDYDYGDDDEINKSNENQVVNARLETNIPTKPPYFEHPEIELHARPGDDVLINCDVRNFQINNVVMWYKNETAITNGQFAMSNAVQVMRNNSILLRNVNSDDADDYYCIILPQKIRMHAKLLVSDVLVITLDGRVVTNHVVTLKQGGIHTLECKTYLETNPKIKWSLNGQRAENVVTKVDGGVLVIDNIDDAQAGQYTCLADDNSDNLPHGMVTIDVHYSPKASTHRHHVNTEAGKTAELYCDYKANPIAITNWLRNGQAISYSEKHTIRSVAHKHQNRTMLTIKDVNANDLGEYECLVENTLGSSSVKIHLIYEPETPQFEDMEIDGRTVRLHWIVRSMQPLSEAILDYKMDGAYTWSTVTVLHTQRHNEHSGIWKITHEMDLPVGEWHSRVKTKNTIGWSKFSPEHDFVVHDDDEDVVEEVPNSPPGDLVMAGIGAGSSKGNGGSSQTTITSSIFTMSLLCLSLLTKFFVPSL